MRWVLGPHEIPSVSCVYAFAYEYVNRISSRIRTLRTLIRNTDDRNLVLKQISRSPLAERGCGCLRPGRQTPANVPSRQLAMQHASRSSKYYAQQKVALCYAGDTLGAPAADAQGGAWYLTRSRLGPQLTLDLDSLEPPWANRMGKGEALLRAWAGWRVGLSDEAGLR